MRYLLAEVVPLASGVELWGLPLEGLLGDKCLDPQLDISSIAWDKRFMTSIVMLPSNFGGNLWRLATMMVKTSPRDSIFRSGSSIGGDGISIPKYIGSPVVSFYGAGQQLWQRGYNGLILPIQTYRVDDLGASDKELADFKLADLPAGSCLCPYLR